MTHLMEKAIERLRAVPEPEQEALARFLLNELEDDERWGSSTARHADALGRLAERVLASDARGECEPLDPDKL